MKNLLKEVERIQERFHLLEEGDRVVLAVSGQKDSLAMMHALLQLKEQEVIHKSIELFVVNVDEGISDDYRSEGISFIKEITSMYNTPLP